MVTYKPNTMIGSHLHLVPDVATNIQMDMLFAIAVAFRSHRYVSIFREQNGYATSIFNK